MVKNRKKAKPSRGFSNKSWKPRKKNLIAFGKRNANNPNSTPARDKIPYVFSLFIILFTIYGVILINITINCNLFTPSNSINPNYIIHINHYYSTNIRKISEKSKYFLTFFLVFFRWALKLPPTTTLKIRLFFHNSKRISWQFVRWGKKVINIGFGVINMTFCLASGGVKRQVQKNGGNV